MTTALIERPASANEQTHQQAPVVTLKRRTIDSILISIGVVAALVFAVAGGLLTWGNQFSSNYVGDELSSQNITFPSAEALTKEGRTDLLAFAGQKRDTGDRAVASAPSRRAPLPAVAGGA